MPDDNPPLDTQSMLLDDAISDVRLAEVLVRAHYAELTCLAVSQLSAAGIPPDELPGQSKKIIIDTLAQVVVHRDRSWEHVSLQAWLTSRVLEACAHLGRRRAARRSAPGNTGSPALLEAWSKMHIREQQSVLLHQVLGLSRDEIASALGTSLYPVDYWLEESRRKLSAALDKDPVLGLPISQAPEAENDSLARALRGFWPEIPFDESIPAQVEAHIQAARNRRRLNLFAREALLVGLVIGVLFFTCRTAGILPKELVHTFKTPTPRTKSSLPISLPTPEAAFYYFYSVQEGDTLDDIAAKAGVDAQDIRILNRYNYFEDAHGLIAGTQLRLPASPSMDWRTPLARVNPPTPPESLTVRSDPQEVLQRIQGSAKNWRTLWASMQIIDYGPPGYLGPPLDRYYRQAWITSPDRAMVIFGFPNHMSYPAYIINGVTFSRSWEAGEYYGDFSEEAGQFLKGSLIPGEPPSLDASLEILGQEPIAGRQALVAGVPGDGINSTRLWIDAFTGVILRREIYRVEPKYTLLWEAVVTAIAYDQDFPADLYDMQKPRLKSFARDPSGNPLENIEDFPAPRPWPETGHEPLPFQAAPSGFDPSRKPVFLQWPETWEKQSIQISSRPVPGRTPNLTIPPAPDPAHPEVTYMLETNPGITVFASRYSLGRLPLQNVEFGACQRSPDGKRIALSVHQPSGFNTSHLYWFSLESPEQIVEVGTITYILGSFAFSPDSQRLAYTTCEGSDTCRWVIRRLDRLEEKLFEIQEYIPYFLAWSPDGNALAILAFGRRQGHSHLFVKDVESGRTLYSAQVDTASGALPSDSPTQTWGVQFPLSGMLEQDCMNP